MKRLYILMIMTLMGGLFSCHNGDWEFDDFDYTATYFPYQYPIRTLVLGDYVYENENDNNLKFLISARVGGLYENNRNWTINYEVNEELVQNLTQSNGSPVMALPSNYYQLNPVNQLVIPKGEFHGSIEVQLTEDFLNDPLAVGFTYVIPIQITSSDADSVLTGVPNIENADPRVPGEWIVTPKNFTLFGIKFVNAYHGKYLHRGKSVISNSGGQVVDEVIYHARYVEQDEVWALKTSGRNTVTVGGPLRSSSGSPGNFEMALTFNDNGTCTISNTASSAFTVTGSGKFVKEGDIWGGKKRDAIHINYEVNDGTYTYSHTDTLVFRDKDVRFEEFIPKVVQ